MNIAFIYASALLRAHDTGLGDFRTPYSAWGYEALYEWAHEPLREPPPLEQIYACALAHCSRLYVSDVQVAYWIAAAQSRRDARHTT